MPQVHKTAAAVELTWDIYSFFVSPHKHAGLLQMCIRDSRCPRARRVNMQMPVPKPAHRLARFLSRRARALSRHRRRKLARNRRLRNICHDAGCLLYTSDKPENGRALAPAKTACRERCTCAELPQPCASRSITYVITPVTDTYSHSGNVHRAIFRCCGIRPVSEKKNVTSTIGSATTASTMWLASSAK